MLLPWMLLSTSGLLERPAAPAATGKYVSPDGLFELNVPQGYDVQTGKGKVSRSYIPICRDDSLVCITFPPSLYPGTTFGSASIEVTLLPAKTRQACLSAEKKFDDLFPIDAKNPSTMIDGARFLHAVIGAAAMSHDIATDLYRGYERGRCYELALRITFTNYGAYSPGTIREFTKRDQGEVHARLEKILGSFHVLQ